MTAGSSVSVHLTSRLKDKLDKITGNGSRSQLIRESVKNQLAIEDSKDLQEELEKIKEQAKVESYRQLPDKFDLSDKQLAKSSRIEKNYPPSSHYAKKIKEYEQELEPLENKLSNLKKSREKILVQSVVGNDKSKEQAAKSLEKIGKDIERTENELEKKKSTISTLKQFKQEVEKKHQVRKKVKHRLIAQKIRDKLLEPELSKLDTLYNVAVDRFEKVENLRDLYHSHLSKSDVNISTSDHRLSHKLQVDFNFSDPGPPINLPDKSTLKSWDLSDAYGITGIPDDNLLKN